MKELKKVCAYCRVSTNSKDQENSFENQKDYFERELSKENGFDLIDIYSDKGLSGTDFRKRDGFNKMLYDAGLDRIEASARSNEIRNKYITSTYVITDRTPKFKYIYVKNSSRFARNTEVNVILNRLRDKGVYVYFLDLNKSTEDPNDNIMLNFMFSIDERESIDKSNKVRFGAGESAKKGKIRVGNQLYGYNYNKEENTLRIIEEEASVVKEIFDLRLEGKGCRQIANELRERNIKTRSGSYFRENVILRILKNPIYTGKVVRNKYDCSTLFGNNQRKLKDRDEWIVQDSNRVDKIIDDDTFDKVFKLIKENYSEGMGIYRGNTKYSGKIKCAKCMKNYTMNRDVKTRKYGDYIREFYNCSTKKSKGTKYCDNKNHKVEEFDRIIKEYCDGYYRKLATSLYSEANDLFEFKKDIILKEDLNCEKMNVIKEEIKKHKNKLNILIDKLLEDDSDIIKDIFEERKIKITTDIKELEKKLHYYSENETERLQRINKINKLLNYLRDECNNINEVIDEDKFIKDDLVYFIVDMDRIKILTQIEVTFNNLIELLNE